MSVSPENVAAHIVDTITDAQRAFILRMDPHASDQAITRDDWDNIDPRIETGKDWPDVYWFGGMKLSWPDNEERITFRFNKIGLAVRAMLAAREDQS